LSNRKRSHCLPHHQVSDPQLDRYRDRAIDGEQWIVAPFGTARVDVNHGELTRELPNLTSQPSHRLHRGQCPRRVNGPPGLPVRFYWAAATSTTNRDGEVNVVTRRQGLPWIPRAHC